MTHQEPDYSSLPPPTTDHGTESWDASLGFGIIGVLLASVAWVALFFHRGWIGLILGPGALICATWTISIASRGRHHRLALALGVVTIVLFVVGSWLGVLYWFWYVLPEWMFPPNSFNLQPNDR